MVQPPVSMGSRGNSARLRARAAGAREEFAQAVARLRRVLEATADLRARGEPSAERAAALAAEIKSLKDGLERLREELADSRGSVPRSERRGEQMQQERAALTRELQTMQQMLERLKKQ